jgi:hypothetical protein
MKRYWTILPSLLLLVAAVPVRAQPWDGYGWGQAPTLSGPWYANGNPDLPCFIDQASPDRAVFTNENGSRASGRIRGDQVWIPAWSPGHGIRGLQGRISGDRIVWPDGNYWSR